MAERQFDFDFTDDSIGTVRILAVPVSGGGGGQTIEVNVDGTNYPIKSIRKISVSGVQGWMYTLDDGSLDGIAVFFADGTGLNTVKTAIEAELSDVVSAAVTGETGSNIEDYTRLTITNRDSTTSVLNVAPVNTSTGKLSAANLPMKSTITAGNTDPVNSVAVIAYINSLDATNTQY